MASCWVHFAQPLDDIVILGQSEKSNNKNLVAERNGKQVCCAVRSTKSVKQPFFIALSIEVLAACCSDWPKANKSKGLEELWPVWRHFYWDCLQCVTSDFIWQGLCSPCARPAQGTPPHTLPQSLDLSVTQPQLLTVYDLQWLLPAPWFLTMSP